ncbi:MAG: hypothetical protein R3C41_21055 [Calditrichia bacterium]
MSVSSTKARNTSTPGEVAQQSGNAQVIGRESPTSLYDKELSSMEEEGGLTQPIRPGLSTSIPSG